VAVPCSWIRVFLSKRSIQALIHRAKDIVNGCPVVADRFLKDAWRERERGALQQAGLEEPKAWYLPDLRERRIQVRTEGGKEVLYGLLTNWLLTGYELVTDRLLTCY
jgi:hypothetical protein